jgi:hypothetical protein
VPTSLYEELLIRRFRRTFRRIGRAGQSLKAVFRGRRIVLFLDDVAGICHRSRHDEHGGHCHNRNCD